MIKDQNSLIRVTTTIYLFTKSRDDSATPKIFYDLESLILDIKDLEVITNRKLKWGMTNIKKIKNQEKSAIFYIDERFISQDAE
jgi:hypothetical protein